MELKNYQKHVINDLREYLKCLDDTSNLGAAWEKYWGDKDFSVGHGGIPSYNNGLKDIPNVCMKVPTGGGKTLIACSAVTDIFHGLHYEPNRPRLVVWLVPSDSILTQTFGTLSNPEHPYHQRLMQDNHGLVEVFNKDQLLAGQGFSLDSVREQLTVCVMSFASLRIDSRKKDVRKVFQENGNLMSFKSIVNDEDLLPDTPGDALIQILRALHPVVIVDESHNAKSNLSMEMLNNLNPSFVLNLTATPRRGSNIISYVDARELQKAHMVKLPVIVYNRQKRPDVMADAIYLRAKLEQTARAEERNGAPYIRPIVLFQAEPKIAKNKETFEKVKQGLLKCGIPEKEIAIKTSDVDDLTGINLLSKDCPIRYIITVNALKEGWDCPFAYILATLANKTSQIDVEQILGRVLRQPYTQYHAANELNMSYVITCSNDFHATLEKVVSGLNNAGFSKKDFRAVESEIIRYVDEEKAAIKQRRLFDEDNALSEKSMNDLPQTDEKDDDFSDIISGVLVQQYERYGGERVADIIIKNAKEQAATYRRNAEIAEENGLLTGELGDMQSQFTIQPEFAQEALGLEIPQFFVETGSSDLFGTSDVLLNFENLTKGFRLNEQDTNINFPLSTGELYEVGIAQQGEAVPKYKRLGQKESQNFREYLAQMPQAKRKDKCAESIAYNLSKNDNGLADPEILAYVKRVIEGMTADEISALEMSLHSYTIKIREKIDSLKDHYREKQFYNWLDTDRIVCKPAYRLPKVISPASSTTSIPKSLYSAEKNDMNEFERGLLDDIVSQENVVWWHRIIERKGMCLNAFINHYPDFMVKTMSGKILLIEAKGDHLDNQDSRRKLKLGRKWQEKAGSKYKYFMVYKNNESSEDGAYARDKFISEILKNL